MGDSKENADYMAKNLKKYGWEYIVCDIQWYEQRQKITIITILPRLDMDEYGRLIPAENRFRVLRAVRALSLLPTMFLPSAKFGIHIMRGIPRQAVHKNTKIKATNLLPVRLRTISAYAHGTPICTE